MAQALAGQGVSYAAWVSEPPRGPEPLCPAPLLRRFADARPGRQRRSAKIDYRSRTGSYAIAALCTHAFMHENRACENRARNWQQYVNEVSAGLRLQRRVKGGRSVAMSGFSARPGPERVAEVRVSVTPSIA